MTLVLSVPSVGIDHRERPAAVGKDTINANAGATQGARGGQGGAFIFFVQHTTRHYTAALQRTHHVIHMIDNTQDDMDGRLLPSHLHGNDARSVVVVDNISSLVSATSGSTPDRDNNV